MKPKFRMMKLTCVVEINCEEGKWVAKSDSLKMTACGDTPDSAVEALKRNLQSAEDKARRDQTEKRYGTYKKAEASEKEPDQKAEQTVPSEDTAASAADNGETKRDIRREIEGADIVGLRNIAEELGVDSEGLTKRPLREKLLETLDLYANTELEDEFA